MTNPIDAAYPVNTENKGRAGAFEPEQGFTKLEVFALELTKAHIICGRSNEIAVIDGLEAAELLFQALNKGATNDKA